MKATDIWNLSQGMRAAGRYLAFVVVFAGGAHSSLGAGQEETHPPALRSGSEQMGQPEHAENSAGVPQGIAEAAGAYGLPPSFFHRLIWQESRFNPRAVSGAGAQGIAQFMPSTARWRGLSDPFEPSQALLASARWLQELWGQFGNLGLAAAAYNAGPRRVRNWLKGQATLPAETRAYVKIITGESADHWATCAGTQSASPGSGCTELPPRVEKRDLPIQNQLAGEATWGLQLIGDPSQTKALSEYRRLQARHPAVLGQRKPVVLARKLPGRGSATWFQVRVAEATRERANDLCTRLKQSGGACVVLRN